MNDEIREAQRRFSEKYVLQVDEWDEATQTWRNVYLKPGHTWVEISAPPPPERVMVRKGKRR